jgi:hypothetical protein
MQPCDPTAPDAINPGIVTRWQRSKQSNILQFYGHLHSDLCNVPLYLLPGVRMQIKPHLTGSPRDACQKMSSRRRYRHRHVRPAAAEFRRVQQLFGRAHQPLFDPGGPCFGEYFSYNDRTRCVSVGLYPRQSYDALWSLAG